MSVLTMRLTENPDGWVTAQIEQHPAAISQGRDEQEAQANALAALRDLAPGVHVLEVQR